MKKDYIPNTWKNLNTHYIEALDKPWYKTLVKLENLLSVETINFYKKKGMVTMHLPVTTGSISSPMGRGSDSLPVKVKLEGVETYLADSMQFLLEYGCRLTNKGVYYIMPSFRGEKADERHLCQFYHSEAEIFEEVDYKFLKCSDEEINFFCDNILKREHLKKLSDESMKTLRECYYNFMHLFNENNSHMGFTVFIIRRKEYDIFNDPELYHSVRV